MKKVCYNEYMTYYEILGIDKNATNEEIKAAHKSLAKKYHPDIFVGDKSFAEEKITEINVAYNTLIDEELRKQYDLQIEPPKQINEEEDDGDYVEGFYNSRLYINIKEALKNRRKIKKQRKEERKIINEQYKILKNNKKLNKKTNKEENIKTNTENIENNSQENIEIIKKSEEKEKKIYLYLIIGIIVILFLLLIIVF